MKKSFVFFVLGLCLVCRLFGQEIPVLVTPKGLTPLKEFDNREDFVMKNFEIGNQRYVRAPLSVFLDDLEREYPFLFVLEKSRSYNLSLDYVGRIVILFYNPAEIKKRVSEGKEVWGVSLFFTSTVYSDEPRYPFLKQIGLNKVLKWNRKKYYSLLKDLEIDNCSVVDYSKDLRKYLEK